MRWSATLPLLVASLRFAAVAAAQPSIAPGAEAWVVTGDIPPYAIEAASLNTGGAGLYTGFVDDHPDNVDAGARYEDASSGAEVAVRVVRQEDTTHLLHFLEGPFRSHKTGRLLGDTTLLDRAGQTVLFYCRPSPNCHDRSYAWRSGTDIVVKVDAKAFVDVGPPDGAPDPRRTPCPEPSEVLDEYLDRYPSTLASTPDSDERAKQWLRDRLGLILGVADRDVSRISTADESQRTQAIHVATQSLFRWAQERQEVFGKPSANREAERLQSIAAFPVEAQIRELAALRDDYRNWWTAHQNDPITLPPP